jgi:hypothetical protein
MPAARPRLAVVALLVTVAAGAPAHGWWGAPPAHASSSWRTPPAHASWRTPPVHASWRTPIEGAALTRSFDLGANPFEGGRHRGIDLAARAGESVRAPCAGEVVVARQVGTSGRVVTLRCGVWRVSHMPLATISRRVGDRVRAGAPLGTAAASRAHGGLHLGVRREGERFGYVDPLRFLAAKRFPPPLAGGRRPPPIRVTRPPRLGPAPRAPRPATNPLRRTAPASNPPATGSNPVALPWPVWVGTALMVGGLGFRWRVRLRVRGGIVGGRPAEGIR